MLATLKTNLSLTWAKANRNSYCIGPGAKESKATVYITGIVASKILPMEIILIMKNYKKYNPLPFI
jgi:hypothetical protein